MAGPSAPHGDTITKLKTAAQRLINNLGHIYRTTDDASKLQAYLRNHILTELRLASLPLPGISASATDADLSTVAWPVVDAFFQRGRDQELSWRPSDMPALRQELHDIVVQLMRIPAKKLDWQDELTAVLRRMAARKTGGQATERREAEESTGADRSSRGVEGQVESSGDAVAREERSSRVTAEHAVVPSDIIGRSQEVNDSFDGQNTTMTLRPYQRMMEMSATNRDLRRSEKDAGFDDIWMRKAIERSLVSAKEEQEKREQQEAAEARLMEDRKAEIARKAAEELRFEDCRLTADDFDSDKESDFDFDFDDDEDSDGASDPGDAGSSQGGTVALAAGSTEHTAGAGLDECSEDELYESSICGGEVPASMRMPSIRINGEVWQSVVDGAGEDLSMSAFAMGSGGPRVPAWWEEIVDGAAHEGRLYTVKDGVCDSNKNMCEDQSAGRDADGQPILTNTARQQALSGPHRRMSYDCALCNNGLSFANADVLLEHYERWHFRDL